MKEVVQKFSTSLSAYEKKVLAELLKQHSIINKRKATGYQVIATNFSFMPKLPTRLFSSWMSKEHSIISTDTDLKF